MNLHYRNSYSYLDSLPDDAWERVENSLARTARGNDRDYVTPLIPDRDFPDEGRMERRDEMGQAILSTGFTWLDEAELAQGERIGAYSIMLPYQERVEQISTYFADRRTNVNYSALANATEALSSMYMGPPLASTSLERAFDEMPKNTNLGLPWATSEKEYRPQVLEKAFELKRGGYISRYLDPCLLYWRGQPRGIGEIPKQRTVWGFPHYITILELSVQIPLLAALKELDDFCAWVGPDRVDNVVTNILATSRYEILSVDFSGFDASVPGVLINIVFDVLKGWFKGRCHPLIEYLRYVFMNIPLLTPRGIITRNDGGIPSGSGLTNLVGGLVQKLAMFYTANRMGNYVERHLVQGDDGVVTFTQPWDLSKVEQYMSEVNLTLHSDKGGVSNERVYYLQNIHSADYLINGVARGVRPLMRVLSGALSYERFRKKWNSFDDTLRWWQQWENASYHPRFVEGVKLLYKWDKYSRGYSADQVLSKAGGLEMAESALNQKSFPYGKRSLSELNNFRVVQVLQELRSRQGPPQRKASD